MIQFNHMLIAISAVSFLSCTTKKNPDASLPNPKLNPTVTSTPTPDNIQKNPNIPAPNSSTGNVPNPKPFINTPPKTNTLPPSGPILGLSICKSEEIVVSVLKDNVQKNVCWDGKADLVDDGIKVEVVTL